MREERHKGYNRWHPDIAPVIEVDELEELALETRDANDGQIRAHTTARDLERLERTIAHPLTGPVYVKGAKPGDLLEIEYLDILPERYGWTRFAPGGGFLPELFDYHFVVHWDINPQYATSPQLPGVRIPNGSFMGTAGVAPSHEQLKRWTAREAELKARGGAARPPGVPGPAPAVPRNFIATMGMPITPEGRNENCDLTLAARNAVIEMIKLLQERGWSREQAYVLCSVAVDLRVSNVVDVPNVTVSALLPEGIFTSGG